MNYCTFIVKILQKPEKSYFKDDIYLSEVSVKFYQFQNSTSDQTLTLNFWGNLATDIVTYYQLNDYIIIEGYICLKKLNNETNLSINDTEIEISVFKIYPYLLNINKLNT
jgi:single-stranded DNA-binding protein